MNSMDNISNESTNLFQQLEGLRFVVRTNRDLLDNNPIFLEFLTFKMDMAQSFIEELQNWEGLGNQSKCKDAIEYAQFFMEQIQVLIDRVLDDQCEQAWLDTQSNFKFNDYSSSAYKYVVSNNIIVNPSCIAG